MAAEPVQALPPRPLRYAARAAAAAVAAGFVILLVYGLLAKATNTTIDDNLTQAKAPPAPGFTLAVLQRGAPGSALADSLAPAFKARQLSLAGLRGEPVVLNFWASWCDPCRIKAPRLEQAWKQVRSRGVLVLGLDMQDITDDARAFLADFHTSYPNVRDRSNGVALRWGVTGLPETFFISRQGRVVGHVIGVVSAKQLQDGIEAAMAGQPSSTRKGGARRSTR